VILSIRSEFYQIGTPHFSLEGVAEAMTGEVEETIDIILKHTITL